MNTNIIECAINKSIESSLENLNDIGLDNIDLSIDDLETAEQFSSIGGDAIDLGDMGDIDMPENGDDVSLPEIEL